MFTSEQLMKPFRMFVLAMFAAAQPQLAPAATNAPESEYKIPSANYQVEILRADWFDAKRDRKVPVKIYFPQTGNGPFPVIIFSHGLGGSREAYEFLGRYWAARGYVSVHLQHLGSDAAVWQDTPVTNLMTNMRKAAANLDNASNRPADVSFAIDQLEKWNREDSPLKNRLDLARIGMAGHSFGSFTTLAIAGQVFIGLGGREISFADPRVKAAVAMSSPVPARKDTLDRAFGKIKIPVLHMTGTEDSSPIGETKPEERRLPFDHIHGADQFLLTLNGGDHMIFAGRTTTLTPEKEKHFKELICESSTVFWDAYLKGDAKGKAWLTNDFKTVLAADGTFEIKPVK
jgi:predicted dienelactone hydrolase